MAEYVRPHYTDFSPTAFLKCHYSSDGVSYCLDRMYHTLRCYHEVFKTLPSGLKVLDYGTGPVFISTISASTKASEIILSDYVDKNCEALQQWLVGDMAEFDWLPSFNYVVQQLEGQSEKEAKERQELVRKLVKAVVHCDITKDPPIEPAYDQLYDVVISSLVLESVAKSHDEYVTYLHRLGKLVKPGGVLMMYTIESKTGFYVVGDIKFQDLHVSAEFIKSILMKGGFIDVTVDRFFPGVPNKIFSFLKCKRSV